MPLVKIEIIKGKSQEYKQALLDGIHDALVEAFKIPEDDRIQRLYELDRENFEACGKSDHFTLIEIIAFPGRSLDAKRKLYQAIVRNLGGKPGIPALDIFIVLHEPPLDNWGIRGGQAASDAPPAFKLDV